MTNSRTESATRNKKRRVEFVDDAPEEATRARNSVVDQTDPLKLVGSRLEPIHGLLESQPPSLQTNIIRLTKLMLEKARQNQSTRIELHKIPSAGQGP